MLFVLVWVSRKVGVNRQKSKLVAPTYFLLHIQMCYILSVLVKVVKIGGGAQVIFSASNGDHDFLMVL